MTKVQLQRLTIRLSDVRDGKGREKDGSQIAEEAASSSEEEEEEEEESAPDMKVHHLVLRDAAKRNHQMSISLGYEICQKIDVTAILVRNHAICYFCYLNA